MYDYFTPLVFRLVFPAYRDEELEKITLYNKVMSSLCDDYLTDFIPQYITEVCTEVIDERESLLIQTNAVFADIITVSWSYRLNDNKLLRNTLLLSLWLG